MVFFFWFSSSTFFSLGIADLGDYETCTSIGGARYGWVGFALNSSYGICVPDLCDQTSIQVVLDIVIFKIPQLNQTGVQVHLVEQNSTPNAAGVVSILLCCVLFLNMGITT